MTIQQFEKMGGKVTITHWRAASNAGGHYTRHAMKQLGVEPSPRGGVTEVVLEIGGLAEFGAASARHDRLVGGQLVKGENYNRKLGRTIAFGRAWKKLQPALIDHAGELNL